MANLELDNDALLEQPSDQDFELGEATDLGLGAGVGGGATPESEEQQEEAPAGIDPNSLPPELVPIYKSMQRDYTRKTQRLAQLERELQWARELQELARTNPGAARDLLLTIANHLAPSANAQHVTEERQVEPPPDLEFESEAVRKLWERNAQLEQQLQAMQQILQATVQHAFSEELEKQLVELEREFGEIDRQALVEEAKKRPHLSLREVYILTNYPQLVKQASKQAYRTQSAKRLANPIEPRANIPEPKQQASTLEEAFQLALRDLGLA